MRAVCECSNTWELQKELDAYADGPRCPKCQSREVEIENPEQSKTDADPVASEAFRRFREGDEALDLVCDGLCSPERAQELEREFLEMSDHRILTTVELLQIRQASRQEGMKEVLRYIDENYVGGIDTRQLASDLGI